MCQMLRIALLFLGVMAISCAGHSPPVDSPSGASGSQSPPELSPATLPPSQNRPKVAIAGFENRSTYSSDKLWDTSSQLLSSQLVRAGYFRVVEWERMKQLFDWRALSTMSIVKTPQSRDQARKILLCEYFITGAITFFDVAQEAQVSALSKSKTFTTTIRVDLLLQDAASGEYLSAGSGEWSEKQVFSGAKLGTWDPKAADQALDYAIGHALVKLIQSYDGVRTQIEQEKAADTVPVQAGNPQATAPSLMTVEAEGTGSTRQDALLNAKRNAVEQGVGTLLISQTEIENYQLKRDIVLSRTIGAVHQMAILTEKTRADGSTWVKIRADVSTAAIKENLAALKILIESMEKPRMMVLIQEPEGKYAETKLADYLLGKGFDVVDTVTVAALQNRSGDLMDRAAAGDPTAAARVGTASGAEFIITGSVKSTAGVTTALAQSDLKMGLATITARIVNCSNGRIIASTSARGEAYDIAQDAALSLASENAALNLMDQKMLSRIIAAFQDMINNGMPLTVTIANVDTGQLQKSLLDHISVMPGTVSVTPRNFGNNRMELSVLYKGTAHAFGNRALMWKGPGKRLKLKHLAGFRVDLQVQ